MPLSDIAVICWMRGLSVAIAEWQIMHVFKLGRPARGPLVTASWQYSVHLMSWAMCVLCGNSIGCRGFDLTPKNSLTACPSVSCDVVNTSGDAFGESALLSRKAEQPDTISPHAAHATTRAAHTTVVPNRASTPERQKLTSCYFFVGPRLRT